MADTPAQAPLVTDPDKPSGPWSSRKFLALMFAMATNKILLGIGLFVLKDNVDAGSAAMWWWMMTMTVTDGFLATGGILGIAYVDRYASIVKVVAKGGSSDPVE